MLHLIILLPFFSVGPLSFVFYSLSKFTAIGNHIWFDNFIDRFTGKIKNEAIRDFIVKKSYSKILICRPCHSFWLTLIFLLSLIHYLLALVIALIVYKIVLKYDERQKS